MDHLKEFINRSSVQPLAVSTHSPDDQISSSTLVTTRGREERGENQLGLHGHPYFCRSPPIYRLQEYKMFTKTLVIMSTNGYYVAYKQITLPCILFMLIEMKFIHCYSCVMFTMKSMSMCDD